MEGSSVVALAGLIAANGVPVDLENREKGHGYSGEGSEYYEGVIDSLAFDSVRFKFDRHDYVFIVEEAEGYKKGYCDETAGQHEDVDHHQFGLLCIICEE